MLTMYRMDPRIHPRIARIDPWFYDGFRLTWETVVTTTHAQRVAAVHNARLVRGYAKYEPDS
jgi:hypothetical protein